MSSFFNSRFPGFCVLVLVLSVTLAAQKGGSGGSGGGGGKGGPVSSSVPAASAPNNGTTGGNGSAGLCTVSGACLFSSPRPMPATPTRDDPTCFLAPAADIHSPTVSLIRLEVPRKANQEYEKACSAIQHKKFPKAEEHLREAVTLYPNYAAAWVLLGQIQELQHKPEDAAQSCSRAQKIDSDYAPSYLCLAHLVSAEQKWDQLRQLTDHLLQLHPINASNAYYYNALAYVHLNKLSAAEASARRGVADSKEHHQPRLHLLLAEIYKQEGDRTSEIAELREYLKRDPRGDSAVEANALLNKVNDEVPTSRN